MNCEKAKTIQLTMILDKLGVCKNRISGNDVWYLSPFRKERNASFKVNTQKNVFYDFGEGFGGNTLDFVMYYYKCDVADALKVIDRNFNSFSFHQQLAKNISDKKPYEITSVQPLNNPLLIQYLKSRKLHLEICRKYLSEVHYQINGKKYFGVGFKNDKNGFEIRNKYVKLCLGSKWHTHIKNNAESIAVFESWSDFIAMMTLYPKIGNTNDFFILNSLAMLANLDVVVEKYNNIFLALDRDKVGTKATEKCMQKWKGKCRDLSYLYPNTKDVNDFLIKKTPIRKGRKL